LTAVMWCFTESAPSQLNSTCTVHGDRWVWKHHIASTLVCKFQICQVFLVHMYLVQWRFLRPWKMDAVVW